MLIHVRRVIVVGPDEMRVVAFSPSREWQREMQTLLSSLGSRAAKQSHVLIAEKDALDDALADKDGVFRCPACDALRPCSVYESQCERIADSMSLLSICQRGDGHWAWLAPEQVIELSGVAVDPEADSRMRRALGLKSVGGGLKDSIYDMLNEELFVAKSFVSATRSRLKKKVAATAGTVASKAVDDIIDNVADFGAHAFKQRFKAASASAPSASASDEYERAADLLGVSVHASHEEIDAAWRRMAQLFHPDRNPDSQEWASRRMAEINDARSRLKSR